MGLFLKLLASRLYPSNSICFASSAVLGAVAPPPLERRHPRPKFLYLRQTFFLLRCSHEDEEELLFTIDAAGEVPIKKVRTLMIHYLSLYSIEKLGSSAASPSQWMLLQRWEPRLREPRYHIQGWHWQWSMGSPIQLQTLLCCYCKIFLHISWPGLKADLPWFFRIYWGCGCFLLRLTVEFRL